jgi:hypothetical protein
MWLVLQPILVIGMLWNDKLFVAAIFAALSARFTSLLLSELARTTPPSISIRVDRLLGNT